MKMETITVNILKDEWWWGVSCVVMLNNGKGIAEVQLDESTPNLAYIRGLSVHPDIRRKGVGRQLLLICHEIALSSGCKFCQLHVEKDKDWLVRWYESMGYVKIGIDEHNYTMIWSSQN